MNRLVLLSLALAGCLSVPEGRAPECENTDDCDRASGEVCEEGTCWGNPPPGPFAALVSPPKERLNDLVSREILDLPIPDFGWIGDIALDEPVTYTTVVRAVCPPPLDCTSPLNATIRISRPSLFDGGPGFHADLDAVAVNGGTVDLIVPRTRPSDQPYTVLVLPEDAGPGSSAEVVPPMRYILPIPDSSANNVLDLGAVTLPQIDGTVQTAAGVGLKDYRVVAIGRWDAGGSPAEVSTVFYTGTDGKFSLKLSPELPVNVELVAKPYLEGDRRPAFHLGGVSPLGAAGKLLIEPAQLGKEIRTDLAVQGVDGDGEVKPVVGAHVLVSALVPAVQQGGSFTTVAIDEITDSNGLASLVLRDGTAIAGSYRVSVIPPASSLSGVIFGQVIRPGESAPLILPNRIALRGIARDANGDPLGQASVTARPSLRFQWSLPEDQQAFLTAIPAATTVTPDTGEFVVFVDPLVAEVWGHYDLTFEPSSTSRSPTFVQADLEIPRDSSLKIISMPDVYLPDAAFVHGRITDPFGNTIDGGELKLFRVQTSTALCEQVPHAPASCPIPATLLGRGAAEDDGVVELRLPR